MKKIIYSVFAGVALALHLTGCSTEKNTGITRAYHNITTRYNVMFNAGESYKNSIRKAVDGRQDDYTQMLPLFLYGDESVAQIVAGDMDAAANKATKAVNFHSIKVKPKVGKRAMTPAERQFYDRREFNKYMDDCYLIIGKSYVYTGQYSQALQTFNFMETEFPGEACIYEARLWRAKTLILDRNFTEAERLLTELQEDADFPDSKTMKAELEATIADWHISQKAYPAATEHLNIAVRLTRNKKTAMRWRYVLAQLYMQQEDYPQASALFQKVIRMNPPYEMSFNATINRAVASKNSGTDIGDVKKQLNKMLHDRKNTEYLDQLYYALAEIELYEGNTDVAIELFRKSAHASTVNLPQKTKSYLTLGDLFYGRREYIPAQAYYDSAMVNLQPDYPGYIQISSKTANLTALAHHIQTVHFQDSVQRIARMTEAERNKLISGIITELQAKEQKEKEAEAMRMQQYYNNAGRRSTMADPTVKAQWYFYNPTTVSQGIGEFQVRWGRRALEDNWRRKDKGTLEMAMSTAENAESNAESAGAAKIDDVHTPGYYLQNIPLTDSMMMASNRMIEESLFAAGYIYNNDFNEAALAAAQYESLLQRYPQTEYLVPSYYYLYLLHGSLGKTAEVGKYKELLLAKAPESVYAKIILDPSYLDKLAQQKGETEQLYEQAYLLYGNADYPQVVSMANDALQRFPKDILAPKFAYLKALSVAKMDGTNEAMRNSMKDVVTSYPNTDIAAEAQNIINFIDNVTPEMKQAEQVERAKALYTYTEAGAFYFGWLVDAKENINQLSFDVQSFNIDRFTNVELKFESVRMSNSHILLLVKGFSDYPRAQAYLRTFVMDLEAMKNVRYSNTTFLISESNFAILTEDKKPEDYIEFFKKEYLRQ